MANPIDGYTSPTTTPTTSGLFHGQKKKKKSDGSLLFPISPSHHFHKPSTTPLTGRTAMELPSSPLSLFGPAPAPPAPVRHFAGPPPSLSSSSYQPPASHSASSTSSSTSSPPAHNASDLEQQITEQHITKALEDLERSYETSNEAEAKTNLMKLTFLGMAAGQYDLAFKGAHKLAQIMSFWTNESAINHTVNFFSMCSRCHAESNRELAKLYMCLSIAYLAKSKRFDFVLAGADEADYQKAREYLENYLQSHPDDVDAAIGLHELWLHEGDTARALKVLHDIKLRLSPTEQASARARIIGCEGILWMFGPHTAEKTESFKLAYSCFIEAAKLDSSKEASIYAELLPRFQDALKSDASFSTQATSSSSSTSSAPAYKDSDLEQQIAKALDDVERSYGTPNEDEAINSLVKSTFLGMAAEQYDLAFKGAYKLAQIMSFSISESGISHIVNFFSICSRCHAKSNRELAKLYMCLSIAYLAKSKRFDFVLAGADEADYQKAREYLENYLQSHPDDADVALGLHELWLHEGDAAKALKVLHDIKPRLSPKEQPASRARILGCEGYFLAFRSDTNEITSEEVRSAYSCLREAVELDPAKEHSVYAVVLNNLCTVYQSVLSPSSSTQATSSSSSGESHHSGSGLSERGLSASFTLRYGPSLGESSINPERMKAVFLQAQELVNVFWLKVRQYCPNLDDTGLRYYSYYLIKPLGAFLRKHHSLLSQDPATQNTALKELATIYSNAASALYLNMKGSAFAFGQEEGLFTLGLLNRAYVVPIEHDDAFYELIKALFLWLTDKKYLNPMPPSNESFSCLRLSLAQRDIVGNLPTISRAGTERHSIDRIVKTLVLYYHQLRDNLDRYCPYLSASDKQDIFKLFFGGMEKLLDERLSSISPARLLDVASNLDWVIYQLNSRVFSDGCSPRKEEYQLPNSLIRLYLFLISELSPNRDAALQERTQRLHSIIEYLMLKRVWDVHIPATGKPLLDVIYEPLDIVMNDLRSNYPDALVGEKPRIPSPTVFPYFFHIFPPDAPKSSGVAKSPLVRIKGVGGGILFTLQMYCCEAIVNLNKHCPKLKPRGRDIFFEKLFNPISKFFSDYATYIEAGTDLGPEIYRYIAHHILAPAAISIHLSQQAKSIGCERDEYQFLAALMQFALAIEREMGGERYQELVNRFKGTIDRGVRKGYWYKPDYLYNHTTYHEIIHEARDSVMESLRKRLNGQ